MLSTFGARAVPGGDVNAELIRLNISAKPYTSRILRTDRKKRIVGRPISGVDECDTHSLVLLAEDYRQVHDLVGKEVTLAASGSTNSHSKNSHDPS